MSSEIGILSFLYSRLGLLGIAGPENTKYLLAGDGEEKLDLIKNCFILQVCQGIY